MYHYYYAISLNTRSPPDKISPWLVDIRNHSMILGKSGTGKSNYLRLILDSLDKKDCNIVLLDPHGGVSDHALKNSSKNAILLSGRDYPGAEGKYTGINALQFSGESSEAHLVSSWLRQSFYLEDGAQQPTWGPRLDQIFSNILVGCMLQEEALTLDRFAEILADPAEVLSYFPKGTDDTTRKYIQAQNSYRNHWADFISSTMNKLLPMVRNPLIGRVISMPQKESVDLDAALTGENNIIIPDIEQGFIGADAVRVISTIVLYRMWNVLINRGPSDKKTYVMVDEAQLIPSGIMKTLLSQGRKYGIVMILSFQDLRELNDKLASSVLSNVQNFSCFRLSYEDADRMSRDMYAGNRRIQLLDVLMKQDLHDTTIFSGTGSELYGPVTVSPPFLEKNYSSEEISAIKAEIIIRISNLPKKNHLTDRKIEITHDRMKYAFARLLKKEGLNVTVEDQAEDTVPDLIINYGRKKVYCEVEDSDLKASSKIVEKMCNYSGHPLVFICRQENFSDLITVIRNISDMSTGDRPYRRGKLEFSKKNALPELLNIFLITYSDGKFLFFDGMDMVAFSTEMLGKDSSFLGRAKMLPVPDTREAILRDIIEGYSKDRAPNLDALEEKHGREGFRNLVNSLRERGYKPPIVIGSLLELDRIGAE